MNIINKLSKFITNIFINNKKCKHINKKELYRDYQERYVLYECLDCKEKIYEDM